MRERLLRWAAAAALAAGLCVPAAAPAQSEATLSLSDARLALMQLAAGTGQAQTDLLDAADRALYLQEGQATLSGLVAAAEAAGLADTLRVAEDGTVTALRPIVVLQGAELILGPGDRLRLDRREGAFLLSLGRTRFDGAEVASSGGRHPRIAGYRPFIAGLGESSLHLQDSRFVDLGYGGSRETGGVALSGRGLLGSGTAGAITGNEFVDLRTVSLRDLDDLEFSGNRLIGNRGSALRLDALSDARVHDNEIRRPQGAEALHASDLSGGVIARNRFLDGQGKGVRLDDRSRNLRFADNEVTGFDGSGLTLAEGAACIWLDNNRVAGNRGAGIAVRETGAFILSGNAIERNVGPGLAVVAQHEGSEGLVLRNRFAKNRQGLRGSQLATLRLARNDLGGQMPRLFGGDLDQHSALWLSDRRDDRATSMVIDRVAARSDAPLRRDAATAAFAACGPTEEGGA
ncbi:right-handed parallel beta-helix repeat-containing protein [Roseivivax sp. CAU 1761]